MARAEHEVAHVHDVRLCEGDHGVAAGMARAVVPHLQTLEADVLVRRLTERLVRVGLLVCVATFLG